MIPDHNELQTRLANITPLLADAGIDGALISSNANIIYTTGCLFRGYVYIHVPAQRAIPFVIRGGASIPDSAVIIRKPEQIPDLLAEAGIPLPRCLGLEYDTTSYSDIVRLTKAIPAPATADCSPALATVRMTKTEYEISQMRYDGLHQAAVYARVASLYKPGMTDIRLQIEIERQLRLEGSLGYYRTRGPLMETNLGTLLAGDNADRPTPYDFAVGGGGADPALPTGADGTVLADGMTISADMNGCFNSYQTDMTRVWSIGNIDPLAARAHETSRRILRRIEKMAVPGTPAAALYNEASAMAEAAGLLTYFMGYSQKAPFIGHGVGLELNERPVLTPRSKDILRAGMTIAVEPKFVIPGTGPAGVENTYVVTESGLECLTPAPEEIIPLRD